MLELSEPIITFFVVVSTFITVAWSPFPLTNTYGFIVIVSSIYNPGPTSTKNLFVAEFPVIESTAAFTDVKSTFPPIPTVITF